MLLSLVSLEPCRFASAYFAFLFWRHFGARRLYVETNPRFILTFFDVALSLAARGWRADVVWLQRDLARTLQALVARGYHTLNAATGAELLSTNAPDAGTISLFCRVISWFF